MTEAAKQRYVDFLGKLTDLSERTGIYIGSCSCCESIFTWQPKQDEIKNGRYTAHISEEKDKSIDNIAFMTPKECGEVLREHYYAWPKRD